MPIDVVLPGTDDHTLLRANFSPQIFALEHSQENGSVGADSVTSLRLVVLSILSKGLVSSALLTAWRSFGELLSVWPHVGCKDTDKGLRKRICSGYMPCI